MNSGDLFQLANNKELIVTNCAGLGINMGETSVGSIGVVDNVALLSPNPISSSPFLTCFNHSPPPDVWYES